MCRRPGMLSLALVIVTMPAVRAAADVPPDVRYIRTSWDTRDGLPSNIIWAMAQDRDGYLWLGTNTGLVRFDGVRFVRWDAPQGHDFPHENIRTLCASRDGSLWVGFLTGGISRIRGMQVSNYGPGDGVPDGVIVTLLEDREGTIWAGGRGLSRFRDGRWERVDIHGGFSQQPAIYTVYEDLSGALWIGTSIGVLTRLPEDRLLRPVGSFGAVRAFSEDGAGNLWGAEPERITSVPLKPDRYSGSVNRIDRKGVSQLQGKDGALWIGTLDDGLLRVVTEGGGSRLITHRYSTDVGLTNNRVLSLLFDREGNLWVGTQNGLNRLRENRLLWTANGYEKLLALGVEKITSVKDGSVWVGTRDGLFRFSESGLRRYGRRDGLPGEIIRSLYTDANGILWTATDRGLARYRDGRFRSLALPFDEQPGEVLALTVDDQERLWLSDLDRGVLLWDGRQLVSLASDPAIGRKVARVVYADRAGRVWLSFRDGTLVLHENGRFRVLSPREGVVDGNVRAFYEDSSGTLWIGTSTGLSRLDGSRFVRVTTTSGVPIRHVTAIVGDDRGDLWLGVGSGIMRLTPASSSATSPSYLVTSYDMSDGLRGVPTYLGSGTAARSGDGTLWFVTTDGVAVINPHIVPKQLPTPAAKIEEIVVDGQTLGGPLPPALPGRPIKLEIAYTALTLTAPGRVRFRYRLEGFDTDWVDAGTRRQAFYTNLPPGEYRFHVRTNSDLGDPPPGNQPPVWEFAIAPAFYQTSGFLVACTAALALAFWGLWQLRLHRLRREFALVLAERTRMGREIHDTLLQSMVGVVLQFDQLLSEVESAPLSAKRHIEDLRSRVEGYVRETRQSIWNLRSPAVVRRYIATALREAAESLIGSKALRFQFTVSGRPQACSADVEEQLLRIGQEAVANAIQHGRPTQISMELCYESRAVRLRVTDDGCGFDAAERASQDTNHFGLATMQERADHIGGQLRITSAPSRGTEVEIVAPLRRTGTRTGGRFWLVGRDNDESTDPGPLR